MMCLTTITDPEPDPNTKGLGEKVLQQCDGQLFSLYYGPGPELIIEEPWVVGTWYTAGEHVAHDASGRDYRAGIHIFCDRLQAESWRSNDMGYDIVVRKVEWQGLICRGRQEGLDVLVVERARLLEE